jgi:hypothetical protein
MRVDMMTVAIMIHLVSIHYSFTFRVKSQKPISNNQEQKKETKQTQAVKR